MGEVLRVFGMDGSQVRQLAVEEFIKNWNPKFYYSETVFQTVISERSSTRLAKPQTRTKGEVSGSGKKPYKQKHTGRARQGSRRNPQFVGGGVVFGPTKEMNRYKKVNKRVRALAFKSCWVQAIMQDKVFVIDPTEKNGFAPNRTKTIATLLEKTKFDTKRLFLLVRELDEKLVLGTRNIKGVEIVEVDSISLNDLMKSTALALSMAGFEWLRDNYFQKWS